MIFAAMVFLALVALAIDVYLILELLRRNRLGLALLYTTLIFWMLLNMVVIMVLD